MAANPMHRLLLIESSPTLRRGMEKLLHRYGFEVTSTPARKIVAPFPCVSVLTNA